MSMPGWCSPRSFHVLTAGCAWRHLPEEYGASKAIAHRRFVAWTEAELWQ
jgi:transposase